jgi:hypothetical protein
VRSALRSASFLYPLHGIYLLFPRRPAGTLPDVKPPGTRAPGREQGLARPAAATALVAVIQFLLLSVRVGAFARRADGLALDRLVCFNDGHEQTDWSTQ